MTLKEAMKRKPSGNKYHNEKIVLDGETFDSRKEANRWAELKMLEKAKVIHRLQRQVSFELIPKQMDFKTGKVVEHACSYVADFVYFENGVRVVEDVKSSATRTDAYIIKRKLMLQKHGIRIREV